MHLLHHDDEPSPALPGDGTDQAKMPGHWVLARIGKRVLRPGGRALTDVMLDALDIKADDRVVELAPGMGATTRLVLARRPATYTGVERDEHAAAHVRTLLRDGRDQCCRGTAQDTGLADGSATVVFGEAFLTMQSDDHKLAIAREAHRVLAPGGRYGLHELTLRPDDLDPSHQGAIRGELARSIHVGARPLTVAGWRSILESAGFAITFQRDTDMGLLRPRRIVDDEGVRRAATIAWNLARNPAARRRVLDMRATFRRHGDHLGAVALVATKT